MSDRATERYLGIGALSQELGVSPSGVRRWERIGLIPPAERIAGSGRRLYRLSDLQEIRQRVAERSTDRQHGDRESVAV